MSQITLHNASCLDWLKDYDGPLFDSCVTDPPYHLASIVKRFGGENSAPAKVGATGAYARASKGFMGKEWDGGDIAFRSETWKLVFDALKPGAHLVAFSGTRTYHRMACAIEDAGFEIRDQLAWMYGSGFPKSHNISKAIDKAAGAENPATPEAQQWQGYGTSLKPAHEPICLAKKPISEKTVAANVLKHGTGAINIDGCRVGTDETIKATRNYVAGGMEPGGLDKSADKKFTEYQQNEKGRFPANIIHDGSDEVLDGFPDTGAGGPPATSNGTTTVFNAGNKHLTGERINFESGSAARFFYEAKQDTPCALCGMPCSMSEWNVNTAESNSPTPDTQPANTAGGVARAKPQTQKEVLAKASSETVPNAESTSKQPPAQTASIAAQSVPAQPLESLALNVKSAANLCDCCATAIAQNLAALGQGQDPASLQFPASMSAPNAQILRQSLALYVAGRENTDTITTIPSLKLLLGSVSHAIAQNTLASDKREHLESSEKSKRFWYSSKAGKLDRLGSKHATIKPVDLMRWLCRLVTPKGGHILEPFAGSGTTGIAAMVEHFDCTMIEMEVDHCADIERKLAHLRGEGAHKLEMKKEQATDEIGGLFANAP